MWIYVHRAGGATQKRGPSVKAAALTTSPLFPPASSSPITAPHAARLRPRRRFPVLFLATFALARSFCLGCLSPLPPCGSTSVQPSRVSWALSPLPVSPPRIQSFGASVYTPVSCCVMGHLFTALNCEFPKGCLLGCPPRTNMRLLCAPSCERRASGQSPWGISRWRAHVCVWV